MVLYNLPNIPCWFFFGGAATHIYNQYECEIKLSPALTPILVYIDDTPSLQIVDPTT